MQVVLVAVNADGKHLVVGSGLQNAHACAASGRVNHVCALGFLRQCQLGALHRIVPSGRCCACHVGKNCHISILRFRTLCVATSKVADQRDVHAADEADSACLGRHRRSYTNKVRALLFSENYRAHVWCVDNHVDDLELCVWIVASHFFKRCCEREASHDDRVVAVLSKAAQRLLALCVGLKLYFVEGAASLIRPTLCASEGRFVERFVELAAKVENDRRISKCYARGKGQCSRRAKHFMHKGHKVSLPGLWLWRREHLAFPPKSRADFGRPMAR